MYNLAAAELQIKTQIQNDNTIKRRLCYKQKPPFHNQFAGIL